MNFGYVLRILRISAGIGLRELARTVRVSPTYLSLIENGKQPPPNAVRIAQIEDALGVPPGYLLATTHGFNSGMAMFVQEVPEIVDFLDVAKENAMTSADFMELTGYLNTYGRMSLKQTLEQNGSQQLESASNSRNQTTAGPCVWPFLSEEFIFDIAGTKEKISFLEEAVSRISSQSESLEARVLLGQLLERERVASTGIGHGVAIPHAYVSGLNRMIVALLRIPDGLDFEAVDGEPVYLALLLAGSRSAENMHLKLLARIAKLLSHRTFCDSVLGASDPREIISLFRAAEMRIP